MELVTWHVYGLYGVSDMISLWIFLHLDFCEAKVKRAWRLGFLRTHQKMPTAWSQIGLEEVSA